MRLHHVLCRFDLILFNFSNKVTWIYPKDIKLSYRGIFPENIADKTEKPITNREFCVQENHLLSISEILLKCAFHDLYSKPICGSSNTYRYVPRVHFYFHT